MDLSEYMSELEVIGDILDDKSQTMDQMEFADT